MDSPNLDRRKALGRLAALCVAGAGALAGVSRPAFASPRTPARFAAPFPHPDPRPGITAAHVLPLERLPDDTEVRNAYAFARRYPEAFDGLYCACRCQQSHGHRSLLACYESDQPTGCHGCRGEGLLAGRRLEKGDSLQQVRAAVDEEYG